MHKLHERKDIIDNFIKALIDNTKLDEKPAVRSMH